MWFCYLLVLKQIVAEILKENLQVFLLNFPLVQCRRQHALPVLYNTVNTSRVFKHHPGLQANMPEAQEAQALCRCSHCVEPKLRSLLSNLTCSGPSQCEPEQQSTMTSASTPFTKTGRTCRISCRSWSCVAWSRLPNCFGQYSAAAATAEDEICRTEMLV